MHDYSSPAYHTPSRRVPWHIQTLGCPMITTTASGDVFTPGAGIERRTEADVVRNDFSVYLLGNVIKSDKFPGWLTFSFGISQGFGMDEALSADVLMQDIENINPNLGLGTMFSHLAISYESGAHIIAVQSQSTKWWYWNTSAIEAPEDVQS